jgi:hypothetical protein
MSKMTEPEFWVDKPFPRVGFYHSWRILDERTFFRTTEEHTSPEVIAIEIKKAVQAVFKKHYGEQTGVVKIEG